MNITYTQNSDYLIPNIIIRKTKPLGHYGRLRKAYLKMHRPIQRLRIHYNCVGEMNIPNEPALPIPAVTVNTRKGVFVSYTTDDRPAV